MANHIDMTAERDSNTFHNVGSKIINQVGHQTINGGQTNYLFVRPVTRYW
jgi:hypothetical protein